MKSAALKIQRTSLLLVIGALTGAFFGLTGAAASLGLALACTLEGDRQCALGAVWGAAGLLVLGACGAPLLYHAGRELLGAAPPAPDRPSRAWVWLSLSFPVAIGLGYLAFAKEFAAAMLGPLAQILAAGAPVALVALLVRRLGPPISSRRAWTQFLLGLWVTPTAAMAAEVVALVPVAILVLGGLMMTPEGAGILRQLADSPLPPLEQLNAADLVLQQPWLVAVLLGFAALLVPLVEEALKTTSVWPLLRRRISPGEAFVGGVLCGCGYALFESLFLPQPGSEWVVTMVSRVGTTLVHAFTAGISATGLVLAFNHRAPRRALLPYLAAVALHGLWNATVIGIGVGILILPEIPPSSLFGTIAPLTGAAAPALLVVLSLASLVGIVLVGKRLRGV